MKRTTAVLAAFLMAVAGLVGLATTANAAVSTYSTPVTLDQLHAMSQEGPAACHGVLDGDYVPPVVPADVQAEAQFFATHATRGYTLLAAGVSGNGLPQVVKVRFARNGWPIYDTILWAPSLGHCNTWVRYENVS